jgi:hypothetical protein
VIKNWVSRWESQQEEEQALKDKEDRRHHGGSLVGPIVARIAKVAFK